MERIDETVLNCPPEDMESLNKIFGVCMPTNPNSITVEDSTMGSRNFPRTADDISKMIHEMYNDFFEEIPIGKKSEKSYVVPKIELFLKPYFRDMFLSYTAKNNDPEIQQLREILLNCDPEEIIRECITGIAEQCELYNMPVFEQMGVAVTPETNCHGQRIIYRLALDRSKSDRPDVCDLSGYLEPKSRGTR